MLETPPPCAGRRDSARVAQHRRQPRARIRGDPPRASDREGAVSEPGIKLTTYFERARTRGRPVPRRRAVRRLRAPPDAHERAAARSPGVRERHRLQTDRLLTLSESLPVVSVAVDTRERIERRLPEVLELARPRPDRRSSGRELATGDGLAGLVLPDPPGAMALKLTVYGGPRGAHAGARPATSRRSICCARAGAAGASVLLGVDGTLHGERHRARFFARNARRAADAALRSGAAAASRPRCRRCRG